MPTWPVMLGRVSAIAFLIAMASGCNRSDSGAKSQGKVGPNTQLESSAMVDKIPQPGMTQKETMGWMKEHGYATAPVQDYPSADGGGISVYVPRDAARRGHALIVEWSGPLGDRSLRKYVKTDVYNPDASIPPEKVRELLHGDKPGDT